MLEPELSFQPIRLVKVATLKQVHASNKQYARNILSIRGSHALAYSFMQIDAYKCSTKGRVEDLTKGLT